ncbi:clostridium P47 protein [Nemania serpens]|nr:clostridium P47 protein [Nemania serpens]
MPLITTNGWDTVYATNYTNINSQIAAQWQTLIDKAKNLGTINASLNNHKASVNLTMSAWSLTQGGSGGLVCLELPISSGTFSGIDNDYDLAGQTITIQLALQWVPQPNQVNFAIKANLPAIETDLGKETVVTSNIIQAFKDGGVTLSSTATISVITTKFTWKVTDTDANESYYVYLTDAGGSDSLILVYQYVTNSLVISSKSVITPVTVIQAGNIDDEIDGPIFKELISQNIDENLDEFDFVFATVDIVTQLSQQDVWAWLQPTSNEYAVVEPLREPNNDNCVFAILSMVNNNVNPKPVLQVDENAISPDASNALLISPVMFLRNMLAPGVTSVFANSTPDDYTIDEDNLSVTNKNKLTWGNFQLDSGEIISLSVDAEDFAISVENDRITVNFANLSYPLDGLFGVDVGSMNIIFSGYYQLTMKEGDNGNKTLWFEVPPAQLPITNVSTVMNKTYYDIEKAIGIVTICLSVVAIVGAVGGKIATNAATSALEDAGEVTATATTAEIQAALKALIEDSPAMFARAASEDAEASLTSAVNSIKTANVFSTIAKVTGVMAAITGLTSGIMELQATLLEDAAQDKWDNTPGFDDFADFAIDRFSFAGLSADLLDVDLAESMQINFTTPKEATTPPKDVKDVKGGKNVKGDKGEKIKHEKHEKRQRLKNEKRLRWEKTMLKRISEREHRLEQRVKRLEHERHGHEKHEHGRH